MKRRCLWREEPRRPLRSLDGYQYALGLPVDRKLRADVADVPVECDDFERPGPDLWRP